ncbi:MAG: LytR C-terminal domain-containing protein [Cellulomonas sp.]|nr:LytR C-terminal domain-containing protein [Cellulomonas sp.]
MSKASYPYPDDEFDAPGDPDGPRGIHRAPRSAWSRWWPFVVVIVVVPLIAFGGVWYAARNGYVSHIPGLSDSSSTAEADADASASADPTGSAAATETPAATEAPATTAPVAPVLSTTVDVVNAAGISGIAATAAAKLQAAGFTSVTTGNGSKDGATASTVFYASEDLATTAQQVATTLGLTTVTLSADQAGDAITVLLVAKLPG